MASNDYFRLRALLQPVGGKRIMYNNIINVVIQLTISSRGKHDLEQDDVARQIRARRRIFLQSRFFFNCLPNPK